MPDGHSRRGRGRPPEEPRPHGRRFYRGIYISINKAYTAIAFQTETRELNALTQSGQEFFGLSDAHGGRLVIFAGGIPLRRNGEIVGAIGVSTGTVDQDQEVAEAGAAAF